MALDPTQDGRMGQRNSAPGHRFQEITKAQFEPQIPVHTEDDDLSVEMATCEKIIVSQHPDQLHRGGKFAAKYALFGSLHQNHGY
jgi:hypothetical protein